MRTLIWRMQSKHEELEKRGKKTVEVFMLVSTFILTPHTHTQTRKHKPNIYKHMPRAQPLVA